MPKPLYCVYPLTPELNEILARVLDSGHYRGFTGEAQATLIDGVEMTAVHTPLQLVLFLFRNAEYNKACTFAKSIDDGKSFKTWKPKEGSDGKRT